MIKKCYILAGPNGAGKTTFANEFLPVEAECLNFIIDIKRRFERSWSNFNEIYKKLADSWVVFDTSGDFPVIIDESEKNL